MALMTSYPYLPPGKRYQHLPSYFVVNLNALESQNFLLKLRLAVKFVYFLNALVHVESK